MDQKEKKLLNQIEMLRAKLSDNVDTSWSKPNHCENTYSLSKELDQLILQYMKNKKQSL